MDYYITNTSPRLRSRRRFANLNIAGKSLIPGTRVMFSREEILVEKDRLFQLVQSGAIQVRETATGRPVDFAALGGVTKKVVAPEPVVAPAPVVEKVEPPAEKSDEPPSVSDLIDMKSEPELEVEAKSGDSKKGKRGRRSGR